MAKLYRVGGCIRDSILGIEKKLVIGGNKELKIKEYSDIYRKVKIDLQKRFCNLQNQLKLYLRYDSTKAHKNNE